jgi:hypothetical protein
LTKYFENNNGDVYYSNYYYYDDYNFDDYNDDDESYSQHSSDGSVDF